MSASATIAAGPTAERIMWVERVLQVSLQDSDRIRGPQPETGPPPEFAAAPIQLTPETGMAKWTVARLEAITILTALEAAFRQSEDPLADRGIILLRAIRANLTEHPETPQQLAELLKYIAGDEVIAEAEVPNGFGINVELRKPLLTALASLRDDMKAAS